MAGNVARDGIRSKSARSTYAGVFAVVRLGWDQAQETVEGLCVIAQAILSSSQTLGSSSSNRRRLVVQRGTRACTADEPAMRTRPWLVHSCGLRTGTADGLCWFWFWLPRAVGERFSGRAAAQRELWLAENEGGDEGGRRFAGAAGLFFFRFFLPHPGFFLLGPTDDDKRWGALGTWGTCHHQPPTAWHGCICIV